MRTKKGKTVSNKAARTTKNKSTRATSKLEVFVKKNRSQYPSGTWVVFTTPEGKDGKRVAPRVFKSSLSRDAVRGAYAAAMGVSKEDTRSRRVENY